MSYVQPSVAFKIIYLLQMDWNWNDRKDCLTQFLMLQDKWKIGAKVALNFQQWLEKKFVFGSGNTSAATVIFWADETLLAIL